MHTCSVELKLQRQCKLTCEVIMIIIKYSNGYCWLGCVFCALHRSVYTKAAANVRPSDICMHKGLQSADLIS